MSATDSEDDIPAQATSGIVPRLYTESQGSRSLPAHIKSYGPLWEPPSFVHPIYRPHLGWQVQRDSFGLNPIMRARMQAAEADLLYGPSMDVVCDVGWYKGKWNTVEKKENARWGGWFDDLNLNAHELAASRLDANEAREYLPKQLKLPPATSPEPGCAINRTFASTAPSLRVNELAPDDRGSLDYYAGPLRVDNVVDGKEQTTQDKFRFEMFAGCPLDQLVPGKRGYIFNAGGPVWSIDFLPGVDCRKPDKSGPRNPQRTKSFNLEYLALSTISQDPGLIPPSQMRKHGMTAKGNVQIWSVPPIEPIILGCPSHQGRWSGERDQDEDTDMEVEPSTTPTSHIELIPRLKVLLALPSQATVVRWCPRGGAQEVEKPSKLACLGILAIALMDGSVGLYAPPDPDLEVTYPLSGNAEGTPNVTQNDVLTLNLKPRAQLLLPNTSCLTMDWANHDVIAGGCTNGHIVIWHVFDVLKSIAAASAHIRDTPYQPVEIRPTHYFPLHSAPVKSLVWIRTPPINQRGEAETDQDPSILASTGYDGSIKLVDTEDIASSATLIHERGETTSLAFSSVLGSLHLADSDYSIRAVCVKPRDLAVSKKILIQLGLLWQIATSDFHSFVAYAGADGVCGLASMIRPQKYRSRATMWAPKVYQMDFSRKSGELRMLDNLRPDPRSSDGTAVINEPITKAKARKKPAKKGDGEGPVARRRAGQVAQTNSPIGVWPAIVAVHCLSWCPSVRRASILASGMGCGLVRVDAVEGGWHRPGMRFGGIDGLVDGAADPNDQSADREEDDEYMDLAD